MVYTERISRFPRRNKPKISGLTNRRQMRDIWGPRDRFFVGRRRWRRLGGAAAWGEAPPIQARKRISSGFLRKYVYFWMRTLQRPSEKRNFDRVGVGNPFVGGLTADPPRGLEIYFGKYIFPENISRNILWIKNC